VAYLLSGGVVRSLRLALAQINTTVGDFKGNTTRIIRAFDEARSLGVDIIVFPEMAICGYPPEDLLFKPKFIEKNLESLEFITEASLGVTAVVGFVDLNKDLYNAAALIHDGRLAGIYHKIHLPNYGVFDENRYFKAGAETSVYIIHDVGVGISICEDIWIEDGPAATQAYAGAEVIINISASPYHYGKWQSRQQMLAGYASHGLAIVAYNNLVGGQDELVFDGNSMIFDPDGRLIARGKSFTEDMVVADLDVEAVYQSRLKNPKWCQKSIQLEKKPWRLTRVVVSEQRFEKSKPTLPLQQELKQSDRFTEVYDALVLGTRDYIMKNRFEKVVIGLSGGIDSSVTAAIAVDAIGADNVIGVVMPSRYSSPGSRHDAEQLAENLGIELFKIPIESPFSAYLEVLAEIFSDNGIDTTEENIQARIRGNLLMALSNKFGWLVLTTGNKSEMAIGYATLYGDMAGGFAVIKDVFKTTVYRLAEHRNTLAGSDIIPTSVIEKAPSAELKAEQKDTDSIPPYDLLDPILAAYVEEDRSIEEIMAMGYDEVVVRKVAQMVDSSEYKRRQAPPGVKITPKAFGRDRRLPISNAYKG
jgi:NAD+ synthase (glutamine-hydrolysing)